MSLVKKLILAGAVGLSLLGCDPENNKPTQVPEHVRYNADIGSIRADLGNLEKMTTQITDVQEGITSVSFDHGAASCAYKFVEIKGGDAKSRLILLYPHTKYFTKFTPVEITFKRLNNRKISAQEFIQTYHNKSCIMNYIIEADGVIEPDGVKYLEDGK